MWLAPRVCKETWTCILTGEGGMPEKLERECQLGSVKDLTEPNTSCVIKNIKIFVT